MTSTKLAYFIAVFVPFGLPILAAIAIIHAYSCRNTLLAQICAIQA